MDPEFANISLTNDGISEVNALQFIWSQVSWMRIKEQTLKRKGAS